MTPADALVSRVIDLLEKNGYNHHSFCNKADIAESTFKNMIKKNKNPTYYTLCKICKGFDMSILEFFGTGFDEVVLPEPYNTNASEK